MIAVVSASRISRRSDQTERFLPAQADVDRTGERHEPRTYGHAERNRYFQRP